MSSNNKLPLILNSRLVASSQLFKIESLDLQFSNGVRRTYERMKPVNRNAVMMVPITKQGDLLLVREYAAGTNSYELGFPKGLIDEGESVLDAANREMMEEIGFGANQLVLLKEVVVAPSYFCSKMHLLLAQELYPQKLSGDEPEPLDIIRWPLSQADELLAHLDFAEARCITALLLALRYLTSAEA